MLQSKFLFPVVEFFSCLFVNRSSVENLVITSANKQAGTTFETTVLTFARPPAVAWLQIED